MLRNALPLLFLAFLAACSSSSPSSPSAPSADADASDASDGAVDKSATCAAEFGDAVATLGFARFDGTVIAIVPPGDAACPEENSTHLVLQIRTGGAVYRMVVDVSDTSSPGTIRALAIDHAAIGDPWSEGWHTPVLLDYATALGVHSTDFQVQSTSDAVAAITSAIDLGAHVSVYATAAGEPDSAHLIHRNGARNDGAIVLAPESASPATPRWLLFSFVGRTF